MSVNIEMRAPFILFWDSLTGSKRRTGCGSKRYIKRSGVEKERGCESPKREKDSG